MSYNQSVAIGHPNSAYGYSNVSIGQSIDKSTNRTIYLGVEHVDYEKIMIGKYDFITIVKQIEALRNEVDYLKETLVDVLAEQTIKQGEEAMAEERATINE